jgi:hypothetical protein
MRDDALSLQQRRALRALRPAADHGFYLAGGSALCLRLAHRRSIDLDLFRVGEFDAEQMLRELRAAGVPAHGAETQRSTLWFELEGVETRLMHFDRPVLQNPDDCLGVPVASVLDIAAMKIEAISSRGARKDFVDLYFICQRSPGSGWPAPWPRLKPGSHPRRRTYCIASKRSRTSTTRSGSPS